MTTLKKSGNGGKIFALGLIFVLTWNFFIWKSVTLESFGAVFLASLGSPLWFFASAYIIKKHAQRLDDAQQKILATAAADAETNRQRMENERRAEILRADEQARHKIHRAEILNKLGLVTDMLGLLNDPENAKDKTLLLQIITTELREIVAKHPLPQLITLITSDTVVLGKLDETFGKLAQHHYFGEEAAVLYDAAQKARRS